MNVSPLGNSDNIFVHVQPMTSFEYEIRIPASHPQGLFYYHPHQYGTTEAQIMGGMSGLLVVNGLLDPFPQLAGIRERLMMLRDTQIENGQLPDEIDPSAPTNFFLNGLVNPTIDMQPGEMQLWRIGNLGADLYYHLELDGHTLYEVARDGNRHNQLVARSDLLLPPSSRIEVLVVAGAPGKYRFRSLDFDTGPAGDSYPGTTLGTVVVSGDAVAPVALPGDFPPVPDLRTVPDRTERTIVFSEDPSGSPFYIDGKQFDANRVDTSVPFGATEEWTIYNCSQELHVFHIHQLDFQVIDKSGDNGDPDGFIGHQDTVNVPIASGEDSDDENCETGTPGWVKVIIPFTEPENIGKFVYHCHIGEHEDNGMMATIEVTPPDDGAQ
jgi:FtsP/CotA-like multicopper oxidase with cupredoxin domain